MLQLVAGRQSGNCGQSHAATDGCRIVEVGDSGTGELRSPFRAQIAELQGRAALAFDWTS